MQLCRTTMSVVKQLSSDIAGFFVGHCPMSGANIKACTYSSLSLDLWIECTMNKGLRLKTGWKGY